MNLPKYLKINLSNKTVETYPISEDLFKNYLGGKILGAKLLLDLSKAKLDVFSPESVIIINTGPMNGTGAPSSSRFNMTFKNVLTGGIASSNCGGYFGVMLKRAGVDGLIITGRSEKPITLEVIDGQVAFTNAEDLWGLDTEQVQEKLPKKYGKLVIGPAGENLVKFACAASGERVAGRCGSGAVLGAKNIKAIVAYGTKRPKLYDQKGFDQYIDEWINDLKDHPMTGGTFPKYGTAGMISKINASGVLPTHNFKYGSFEKVEKISGEALAEDYLTRNSGCISCPIRCERRVIVEGKEVKGPEFETVGLFGANIENADLDVVNQVNYYADILGMDTISLGGTLAFAMELQEKGLADFGLKFGNTSDLIDVLFKIANREGIYSELAEGTKILSEKYGGKEFAIHSKGLELASYEPRRSVGMGLGYSTSNRGGCHLNGGYLVQAEAGSVISIGQQNTFGKAQLTVFLQNMMEAVSAAGFCLFTSSTSTSKKILEAGPNSFDAKIAGAAMRVSGPMLGLLNKHTPKSMPMNDKASAPQAEAVELATGMKMTIGHFVEIGERGFNIERLYNLREGLTKADDSLPDRLTKTPQIPDQANTVVDLDKMLPAYYKTRGWDGNGVPTTKKLKKLGIM